MSVRLVKHTPWIYRAATDRIERNQRGGYLLLRVAHRLGILDCAADFAISDAVSVYTPLFTELRFTAERIHEYESELIRCLAAQAALLPGPITFIDCGASFGLISMQMVARVPQIASVVAFEPNVTMHKILAANVSRLQCAGQAINAAVSDFVGRGELRAPDYNPSLYALFIEPSESGSFPVTTIDALNLMVESLVLKIDVEGAETNVIRGALDTLRRATTFIATIEANYDVIQRTGIDAMEAVRMIRSVRDCEAVVDKCPHLALRDDVPFYNQVPHRCTYNITCTSR